jgi:hypothetical protein
MDQVYTKGYMQVLVVARTFNMFYFAAPVVVVVVVVVVVWDFDRTIYSVPKTGVSEN